MKNIQHWFPTKYELKNNKLRASRNSKFVGVSSRLITDITARFYQHYLPLHATGKLIDLGCGFVPFYMMYKDLVAENVCVDWPNSAHQNQYLDLTCDLNKPLPLPDAEFDTIILSEVLEHIAEPELLWKEMTRILKPKGKILLSVPFLYKIHESPFDYYRYTEFALRNFADKNGLQILELKNFGGLPVVLTDIFAKGILKFPLIGALLSGMLQRICMSFVDTRIGGKMTAKSGVAYPLGYFMVVQK